MEISKEQQTIIKELKDKLEYIKYHNLKLSKKDSKIILEQCEIILKVCKEHKMEALEELSI